MKQRQADLVVERMLNIEEAAMMLGTKPRFARRLIDERRIRYTHVGRHVRIPESAVRECIEAGMVYPVASSRRQTRVA